MNPTNPVPFAPQPQSVSLNFGPTTFGFRAAPAATQSVLVGLLLPSASGYTGVTTVSEGLLG